ncbi:MAG: hypothetical protein ACOY0T_19215 [Myxococcota bacterium]
MPKILLLPLLASACWGVPHPRESLGPKEFVERAKPERSCDHLVEVVDTSAAARPYQELSRMTATCHPTAPSLCERRLRERACSLGADAVLLTPTEADRTPNSPYAHSQIAQNGIAVRWR